ncbi:MAG: DUF2800 domain-containing protein [Candidatus Spyradenecus sp.]
MSNTPAETPAEPVAETAQAAKPAHHPRSMSRWPAILACPCYEGKDYSADASKGTDVHAKLADWLTTYKTEGKLPTVDTAELDLFEAGAWRCAQYVVDRMKADGAEPGDLHVEELVKIEESGIYGRPDAWWIDWEGYIVVFDFKTFYNPGRDYFPQLAGYAVAIGQGLEDKTGVCTVIGYGDHAEVLDELTNLEACRATYAEAMDCFGAREAGNAEPMQSNWCDLCKHAATCKACVAIAERVTEDQTLANAPAQWDALTTERRAQMMVLAETVEKWAAAVREKAKETLMAGGEIADAENGIAYGLIEMRGRKKPRTADACRMLKSRGATDEALRAVLTVSATDVKAILKGLGVKGKAADALVDSVCDFGTPSVSMKRK